MHCFNVLKLYYFKKVSCIQLKGKTTYAYWTVHISMFFKASEPLFTSPPHYCVVKVLVMMHVKISHSLFPLFPPEIISRFISFSLLLRTPVLTFFSITVFSLLSSLLGHHCVTSSLSSGVQVF